MSKPDFIIIDEYEKFKEAVKVIVSVPKKKVVKKLKRRKRAVKKR